MSKRLKSKDFKKVILDVSPAGAGSFDMVVVIDQVSYFRIPSSDIAAAVKVYVEEHQEELMQEGKYFELNII